MSTYEHAAEAKTVEVAAGIYATSPITVRTEVAGLDVVLTVDAVPMREGRAGRFVCREVRARQRDDGPPVTSDALRSVPVAALTSVHARINLHTRDADGSNPGPIPELRAERIAQARADGPVDETLRIAAFIYRLAVVLGEGPRVVIEDTFKLSRSTAGRWISLARQRGFLGPAEGIGKVGG